MLAGFKHVPVSWAAIFLGFVIKPLFLFTEAPDSRGKPGHIPTRWCPFLRHIFTDNSHYEFLEGPIVFTDCPAQAIPKEYLLVCNSFIFYLFPVGLRPLVDFPGYFMVYVQGEVSTTTMTWSDSPGVTDTSLTKSGLFMQNRSRTEFSLVGWCCIWCKWFSSRISRSFSFMPLLGTPFGIIWSSQLILGALKSPPMIKVICQCHGCHVYDWGLFPVLRLVVYHHHHVY